MEKKENYFTHYFNYHQYYNNWNGKPERKILGGTITVSFASNNNDDEFINWIIKNRFDDDKIEYPNNLYTLKNGKIEFYKENFNGEKLFEYKFEDATLIYFQETFDSKVGMSVVMTISPAIQEYKNIKFIKLWNETFLEKKKRIISTKRR